MAVIGADLGGTKLSTAIFDTWGSLLQESTILLEGRQGEEVSELIIEEISRLLLQNENSNDRIIALGICVPGIYHSSTGKVWAPNIPGWNNFPLRERLENAFSGYNLRIGIDSDRACSILGEAWKGAAVNFTDAIFIAVGTGIGAGILCDGRIIRGQEDIAGAVGWMTLNPVYREEYRLCGNFEYHSSGQGLVRMVNEILASGCMQGTIKPGERQMQKDTDNQGYMKTFENSSQIFDAWEKGDPVAMQVLDEAMIYWGMAAANLVSIFNPGIVIFGGGVFGPASRFLESIRQEAARWAQPVSMRQVKFEISALGNKAALTGAGRLAIMTAD